MADMLKGMQVAKELELEFHPCSPSPPSAAEILCLLTQPHNIHTGHTREEGGHRGTLSARLGSSIAFQLFHNQPCGLLPLVNIRLTSACDGFTQVFSM